MAYGLLFAIPKVPCSRYRRIEILMLCNLGAQTLLEQFQRDNSIQTLLAAMRDAFDFANQEHTFKTIERVPRQAQILTLMFQHVCNCCDFIRSYAKDSNFCT